MMEADLYCTFGLAYASLICLLGMAMFRWLEDLATAGRILDGNSWIGDIVAVLWIGLSMATISWLKVYMVRPSAEPLCYCLQGRRLAQASIQVHIPTLAEDHRS